MVKVVIADREFGVTPAHLDITVRELFECVEDEERQERHVEYLKEKYKPCVALPVEFLQEETGFNDTQAKNFIRCYYGKKPRTHVHFELVADFARGC